MGDPARRKRESERAAPRRTRAEAVRLLRDSTSLTSLLLVRALGERPDATLSSLAADLGITVQAVSTYVKRLERTGWLARDDAGRRVPSPAAVAAMHEGFAGLKKFVDETLGPLEVIEATSAIAATRVRTGEEVGLFMEAGELVARAASPSASRGRALASAEVGDEVVVSRLAGVVELAPGRLAVVKVPAPAEGGARRVAARRVRGFLRERGVEPAVVAARGAGAKVLARKSGFEGVLEFAPALAAFNAAERGLDAALFVSRDLLAVTLEEIDAANASTLSRVPVTLVDLPTEGPPPKWGRA